MSEKLDTRLLISASSREAVLTFDRELERALRERELFGVIFQARSLDLCVCGGGGVRLGWHW